MRMTRIATAACLLVLCGCGSGAGAAGATGTSGAAAGTLTLPPAAGTTAAGTAASAAATSAAATTGGSAVVNDRGNLEESIGQQAGIRNADGGQALIFSVDGIVVDPPCSNQGSAPTKGHFLGVRVRVTTADLTSIGGSWQMSATDFAVIGPDGTKEFDVAGAAALNCLAPSERLTSEPMGSGQQYVGTIVLDSPTPSGTLVFTTPALQGNGWEWRF